MTKQELEQQINEGVIFSCFFDGGQIIGVMGIQDKGDVDLIRHAYVLTTQRKRGIGSLLIQHLLKDTKKPMLIGTWKAATWAIDFYKKQGFSLVSEDEKNVLLRTYWTIPDRQVETSVVMADKAYFRNSRHF
jgi:N-acetylglutamate synthase-like GNAT family acetyltransferase